MHNEEKRNRVLEIYKERARLKAEEASLLDDLQVFCEHKGAIIEFPGEPNCSAMRLCLLCLYRECEPFEFLPHTPIKKVSTKEFADYCSELKLLKEKVTFVPVEDD